MFILYIKLLHTNILFILSYQDFYLYMAAETRWTTAMTTTITTEPYHNMTTKYLQSHKN